MAVDLPTLLKAAPFPEKERQNILAKLAKLTDDQKLRLSTVAWTALSQVYFGQLKYEKDKLLLEIKQGKKQYNKKDFEELRKNLTTEFAKKLEKAETEEDIGEVREELKKHFQAPKASTSPSPTQPLPAS